MIHWKIILKRIVRRIRYIFDFRELFVWAFESCENCGHCFKIVWSVKNQKWVEVYGNEHGCLCLDCFVELAYKKNVKLEKSDFEALEIFLPD